MSCASGTFHVGTLAAAGATLFQVIARVALQCLVKWPTPNRLVTSSFNDHAYGQPCVPLRDVWWDGHSLPLFYSIAYRGHMVVGWKTSRHPEWEIMYAAGLAVREITERGGWARSAVQRHLQVREIYIPGLRGSHEAAWEKRPPGWQRHPDQELHADADDKR